MKERILSFYVKDKIEWKKKRYCYKYVTMPLFDVHQHCDAIISST